MSASPVPLPAPIARNTPGQSGVNTDIVGSSDKKSAGTMVPDRPGHCSQPIAAQVGDNGASLPLLQPREVGAEGPHDAILELDRHVLVVAEVLDIDHLPLAELSV